MSEITHADRAGQGLGREPGSRRRLIERHRIRAVIWVLRRSTDPLFRYAGPTWTSLGRRAQHPDIAGARMAIRTDLAAFGSFIGGSPGRLAVNAAARPFIGMSSRLSRAAV